MGEKLASNALPIQIIARVRRIAAGRAVGGLLRTPSPVLRDNPRVRQAMPEKCVPAIGFVISWPMAA
jgi:hypothetical protein